MRSYHWVPYDPQVCSMCYKGIYKLFAAIWQSGFRVYTTAVQRFTIGEAMRGYNRTSCLFFQVHRYSACLIMWEFVMFTHPSCIPSGVWFSYQTHELQSATKLRFSRNVATVLTPVDADWLKPARIRAHYSWHPVVSDHMFKTSFKKRKQCNLIWEAGLRESQLFFHSNRRNNQSVIKTQLVFFFS